MNPGELGCRSKDGDPGFTLIELMVAMVIMSLGLLTVVHLQVVTVRGHAYARERTEATQIAQGVAEEMRKQAEGWLSRRNGTKVSINDDDVLPNLVVIPPIPAGNQINFSDLRSVTKYTGQDIAADSDFVSAWRINTMGYSPDSGAAPPLLCAGAIYRVHYVAHRIDLPPPAPQNSVIRVTVIVSWDNKDHGQGTNWTNWAGVNNFWQRHMVTETFYLYRTSTF